MLRWGRRLFPRWIWNGAGVIADKAYLARGSATTSINPGFTLTSWVRVSGTLPPRWVLVVRDSSGKDRGVAVAPEVWQAYQIGDEITPEDPLIDVDQV